MKVQKYVIWYYVLMRDLQVLNSPALRWLWFGAQKRMAPEKEGGLKRRLHIDPTVFYDFRASTGAVCQGGACAEIP